METLLDRAILEASSSMTTQPLRLSGNSVFVDVRIFSQSGTATNGLTITVQYSSDLDIWDSENTTMSTGNNVGPYRLTGQWTPVGAGATIGPLTGAAAIPNAYEYMRLMIENGDTIRVEVSAGVKFFDYQS